MFTTFSVTFDNGWSSRRIRPEKCPGPFCPAAGRDIGGASVVVGGDARVVGGATVVVGSTVTGGAAVVIGGTLLVGRGATAVVEGEALVVVVTAVVDVLVEVACCRAAATSPVSSSGASEVARTVGAAAGRSPQPLSAATVTSDAMRTGEWTRHRCTGSVSAGIDTP